MPDSLTIISDSPDFTRTLGETLGRHLHTRTVIGLTGDLGSGKTVLIQGIARGLSVPGEYPITSPTYTIINEYPGRLRLIHADLYRISDPSELSDIGFEEILDDNSIVAVEWADRIGPETLNADLDIRIGFIDDTTRELQFFFYGLDHINLIDQLNNYIQKHIHNNKR